MATITSSGTFSALPSGEAPVQHHSTVEQRFDYDSLILEDALANNTGGFPELEQIVGLYAAAYSVPGRAAAVRLWHMLNIYLNRAPRVGPERTYTP